MKHLTLVVSLLTGLLLANRGSAQPAPSTSAPSAGRPSAAFDTRKPWTRWWWPGSAVDKASLTWQLEKIAAAGIGGVEITPIYGARGYEDRYLQFLSPQYMEMLEHAAREARRLGLGVDMATGTGWPFGGPWVQPSDASMTITLADGRLAGEPTKMMVKRAAPGDEGLVLDPYSPDALGRYLARFDAAFADFPRGLIRSQFHDSFEYYNASWTPKFAEVFQAMHGYDIQRYAAELMGSKPMPDDQLGRLKSDYRETLARLHLDYLRAWVRWSHQHGFIARNQSHGAPANLLDLYANADIPETEIFGSTPFPIPGLRRLDDEVRHDQDLPESLVIRLASSAAHVAGHPLASSESCTWLRDHWKVALAYAKPELDRIFCDGINHVFYHGTVFSPRDVPWPGWLFYASTQFNPNNTWWDDFAALNRYVERVQTVLQGGAPDNDILLYWPFHDILDDSQGTMIQFAVHDVAWLTEQPVGRIARALMDHGYTFDYISDAQLLQTHADRGGLVSPGGLRYKLLVIPATDRMPVATLRQIVRLARGHAAIVFESLPQDVPGLGRLEERRASFQELIQQTQSLAADDALAVSIASGAPVVSDDAAWFATAGVRREPIADHDIGFVRRATAEGHDYFFANLTARSLDGWVPLGSVARTVEILDPLTGRSGLGASTVDENGKARVYLQLAPGASLIVKAQSGAASSNLPTWRYREPVGTGFALSGTWHIEFIKGGPELPAAITTSELKSWTDLGDDEARRFGGTARYRIEFDAPAQEADDWLLDLGDVRESARIKLNGREVGTAWSIPFQVRIGEYLQPGRNVLELEVTNLAANRIRDLDRRGVDWKIMHEINFVNINYRPFDASNWPIKESGLLGPVRLVPLHALKPTTAARPASPRPAQSASVGGRTRPAAAPAQSRPLAALVR